MFNSVVFNDVKCFKQLVRVGASIDGVDKEGRRLTFVLACFMLQQHLGILTVPIDVLNLICSLMHLAPVHGDAALVKMLADNGCESNSESSLHHFFPLHIAAMTTPFPPSGVKSDIKVTGCDLRRY